MAKLYRSRVKYRFNDKTCRYEPVIKGKRDRVVRFFAFMIVASFFGLLFHFLSAKYFPSEAFQQATQEIAELKKYYSLLEKEQGRVNKMLSTLAERDNSIYRVIFEADPIPREVRDANIGGLDRYKQLDNNLKKNKQIIIGLFKGLDKIRRKMYIQTQSYDSVIALVNNKADMLASMPYISPVDNPTQRLASGYGIRMHPIYKIRKLHAGIDFSAKRGTPVYATGKGTVLTTSFARGYGKQIVIDHGYGYKTRYAHLDKYSVAKNQKVKRGDLIGYIGSTGGSTGPHLHYEVLKGNKQVNPVYYFSSDLSHEEYSAVLEKASIENQSLDNF